MILLIIYLIAKERIFALFFIILIYKFYSGRNSSINSVALAVQALHNFTLIHDDIMDDSQLRRGG